MIRRRTLLKTAIASLSLAPVAALAGGHGRLGSFVGKSNHVTTGTAEIAGNTITLLDDFTFDGAPDPKVALGNNGYDESTLLAPLQSNKGKQSYTVPASIDTSKYNEVWIWCEKFNVPLGVAKIN